MPHAALGPVLLLGLLGLPGPEAPPFAIDLTVQVGKESKTAHAEEPGGGFLPGKKAAARPVLEARAGQRVAVRWSLSRGAGQPVLKGVLVHFLAAAEEKAGQAAVPRQDKAVVAESALTMDFRPGDRGQGELSFTISRPGSYLLRLETIGAADVDGNEHFAALDLVLR